MNYLLLVCSDGVPTEAKAAANRDGLPAWLDLLAQRRARAYGERLEDASQARTVQVRDGRTIVTDGPFAESKEFVAGFDIVGAENLDEAIAIAAAHPVARFHMLEVRPFGATEQSRGRDAQAELSEAGRRLERPVPDRAQRYLLMVCADGIPAGDEEEASIKHDVERWASDLTDRGIAVYGHPLAPADMATTVRVREGETLVTDGPFVETKEFIAGFEVIDCAGLDEAVQIAATHPLAGWHRCEVRPFWRGE